MIGNTFEALYGAILIDIGLKKAQKSIEEFILKGQINIDQIILENRDYKSELLMLFQKKELQLFLRHLKQAMTSKKLNLSRKSSLTEKVLERDRILQKGSRTRCM